MAVQIDTKANIVSKLALGKGHTSNYREHYNESEVSSFLLSAQHIFANKINSNVASIENNGIVAGPIELELEPIFNKDGQEQSYLLKLGSTVPVELQNIINPKTGSIFSAEDRVGYVIDQRFGIGYSPILKKNGEIIYSLDASDWVLDSFGGIITQEVDVVQYLLNLGTTGTLECYVYIGSFVSEVLNISGSNAQLANELSILTQTVGAKLDISTFASISGSLGTNVAVTVTGAGLGRIVKVIGDNSSTEFTINHNLVTEDVVVSIRDNNSGEIIFASVEVLDVNNIKVSFSEIPTTSQYSVTIVGNSDFFNPNANSLLQTISADLYSLNKVNVLDFNESDYVHVTGDETISGNKTFSNDVFINGTLTVAGSATTLNTQHVLAENNLIVVNYGETGSGVTSISAGIQVDRGTENDYFFIYDENKANFRIGEENDLQAVATRDDVIADQSVVIWDDANKKFIDSNFTIAQISGGDTVVDIKDTYVTVPYQYENYTITNSTSTVVPVISISGAFDVTPNDNVPKGTRFRVHDIGDYCGTNPVTISGGSLGKINTDGGAIEFVKSSFGWVLIDKFENIFDRNEITNEISSREGETLIANKIVTPSGGEGLEVRNSLDEIVALIGENGKIQGRSGEFGIIGAEITKTAQGDFTSIGVNVDTTIADEFGNVVLTQDEIVVGRTWTDGVDFWHINSQSGNWIDVVNGTGSTQTTQGSGLNPQFVIDTGSAREFISATFAGSDLNFPTVRIEGSNNWNGTSGTWVAVSTLATAANTLTQVDNTQYRYFRFYKTNDGVGGTFTGVSINTLAGYQSTTNTFDANLATDIVGAFSPSTFKAYDELAILINGAGKVNIAYAVDGGAFSSLVDQDAFKALDDIAYTTQFDLRLQLVGDQRFSNFKISQASSQTLKILSDGSIVASSGKFGISGEINTQSVSNSDFINIGSNVDQSVADEFGNESFASSDKTNSGMPVTSLQGVYSFGSTVEDFFDDTPSDIAVGSTPEFYIDLATQTYVSAIRVIAHSVQSSNFSQMEVWGTDSENLNYTLLGTIDNSPILVNGDSEATYPLDIDGNFRYYKFRLSGTGYMGARQLELVDMLYYSTNNTIDANLASGTSGTFSSSTFKAYDENDNLINGTSKVNVAYSVDGGAFVSYDQEVFKTIGNISYTTQFDLRLQLVGDQRFSRMEISTPNTIMEFTKSGEIRLLESDVAYSTLSKIGFTIPKLTSSEKDALIPSESLMLYNETEANIEFYNGTKWVSGLRKHEEIIGDNSEVNFTITHNFNTRNLTYCILDNNTYEIVDASVSFPTITTALFMFSQPPSTDEYTITIIG